MLGVQLFKGTLHYRCDAIVTAISPNAAAGTVSSATIDASHHEDSERIKVVDPASEVCTDLEVGLQGTCASGEACVYHSTNPLFGTVSFDDIISAWATIFQCITLEGWSEVLYMTSRAAVRAFGSRAPNLCGSSPKRAELSQRCFS